MALKIPEDMGDLFYFSRRILGDGAGKAMAWVYRPECTKCHKAKMGKPVDSKTGKIKIRADQYVCPECNNTMPKQDLEPLCTMEIVYTCPECSKEGEATTPYKLKTFEGVKAYVFECQHCGKKLGITKKMKERKK
ncbi:MAG: hypothetical protein ABIG89_03320 [Candidatus Woesearchaeota archaeon]